MKMEDREQGRDVGTHRPPTSSVPAIWPYSAGSSTTALPLCPLGFKVGPDSVWWQALDDAPLGPFT